jgi:hypothetical protein
MRTEVTEARKPSRLSTVVVESADVGEKQPRAWCQEGVRGGGGGFEHTLHRKHAVDNARGQVKWSNDLGL